MSRIADQRTAGLVGISSEHHGGEGGNIATPSCEETFSANPTPEKGGGTRVDGGMRCHHDIVSACTPFSRVSVNIPVVHVYP